MSSKKEKKITGTMFPMLKDTNTPLEKNIRGGARLAKKFINSTLKKYGIVNNLKNKKKYSSTRSK
tara:strand:- start:47 stop:241 length:195 start_codon:yes stop_codon:yes gene_type:complete